MDPEVFLNDCWSLYFHDPDEQDWSLQSYHLLHNISSTKDWVQANAAFQELWQHGMFFLMREHIQPTWEDESNANGGCLSFKVNKPEAGEYWFHLGCKLLGEVLARDVERTLTINGISMSPKRNYCILRVWVTHHEAKHSDMYHLQAPYYSQIIYKPHTEHAA